LLGVDVELPPPDRVTPFQILGHVVEADPGALWAYEKRGRLALRRKDAAQAEVEFRKALDLRRERFPNEPAKVADGLNDLANALRAKGEHAEADKVFGEALQLWGWSRPTADTSLVQGPLLHIDLTPHLTQKLGENTVSNGNNLLNLPRGVQVFEGVSFEFSNGTIQLGNKTLKNKPQRVDGISVNSLVQKLHFLHSAHWGHARGVEVGRYEVNYSDGTIEAIPIVCGRDVIDWWWNKTSSPGEVRIAWIGSNDASASPNNLQISRTTWINPHPTKEVASLSFACAGPNAEPAPFCVAITTEQPPGEIEPVIAPKPR
jgi:hypothetical protein